MAAPARLCLPVMAGAAAACSSPSAPPSVAGGDEHIACAVAGSGAFKRVCAVERMEKEGGLFLTVRHPDGGFRRFEVLTDGHGLAVVDGADQAGMALNSGLLDVTVGNDRYRFPTTLMDHAAQP